MSPERARVAVIEDREAQLENAVEDLTDGGQTVVATATSMEEALQVVDRIKEEGIQVVVLDGNLSPREFTCREGEDLAERIKKVDPHVSVIAFSSTRPDMVHYGDSVVDKSKCPFDSGLLPRTVDHLP